MCVFVYHRKIKVKFCERLVCCLRASMSKVHKYIGLVWMIYGRKMEGQGAQE